MRFKAGIIQMRIHLGRIEQNFKEASKGIKQLLEKGVNLIVLPELWMTGFAYPYLKPLARRTPEIITSLQHIIKDRVIVIGTFPVINGESLYNTAIAFNQTDILATYNKTHLFTSSGEHKHFAFGNKICVFSSYLGKIGLITCYDLRFPELSRSLVLKGAQILIVSAAWPLKRIEHFRVLSRARAIENQIFVIAANATGTQGKTVIGGHSAIISPYGDVLVEGKDSPQVLLAEIDLNLVHKFRKEIPCLKERRPEVYHEK